MLNIVLVGYFGFKNLGDEAICSIMVKDIKEKFDDEVFITAISGDCQYTMDKYGIACVSRKDYRGIVKCIKESDIVVLAGGSLFQDATSLKSIVYYYLVTLLARMYNKKYYLMFQGVGPLKRKISRVLTKNAYKKSDMAVLRDKESFELIKKYKKNAILASDLVFLYEREEEGFYTQIREALSINQGQKVIVFALKNGLANFEKSIKNILKRIEENTDCKIVFVPFHQGQDSEIIKVVLSDIDAESFETTNISHLLEFLSNASLLVSVRYHGIVFALLSKCPVIPLSYDPKVSSLMQELNINGCLNINNLDEETLYEDIIALMDNREGFNRLIEPNVLELKKRAKMGMNEFYTRLEMLGLVKK